MATSEGDRGSPRGKKATEKVKKETEQKDERKKKGQPSVRVVARNYQIILRVV